MIPHDERDERDERDEPAHTRTTRQKNMFGLLGMRGRSTLRELVMEYFRDHPYEELEHAPVVDWVTDEWLKDHTDPPRDPWRAIRQLAQNGTLVKVRKGVYKYDPDRLRMVEVSLFSEKTRHAILERDTYRCVLCGRGPRTHDVDVVVDHIKPVDHGGTNDMSNGQTLCVEHNLMKRNYAQTEAGKRYFIRLYRQARAHNDQRTLAFCRALFDVYDRYGIDRQIERPDGDGDS